MPDLSVLHVCRTYFPESTGGIQEAIRQIATSVAAYNIKSNVFTLARDPSRLPVIRTEGIVYQFRSWIAPASCDVGGFDAFQNFLKLASQADIIHYHFPWPFADLLHLIVCPTVPAVMTYHSDIVRQSGLARVYRPLMWHTLSKMRFIVATSPEYAKTSPVLANPRVLDRVRVIPLGIDESTCEGQSDASILNRYNLLNGQPFFLFLGVPRYYKGLHTLLDAASLVNAKIVIAGDGPESEALQTKARKLTCSNLIFGGHVSESEKVTLLRNCRALVLPSHLRSEAFGMVLVEAAMFGKPIVSCEIGTGTSFVNCNNESGFVVPPESPGALAEAMNRLLVDDELVSRLGRNARKRYEALFSGGVLGKAYSDLYREVLNE